MKEETVVDMIREIVETSHKENCKLLVSMLANHEEGPEHQFIQVEMQREQRRQEMWDRLKGNLIFWLLTGITATIGLTLWNHFVDRQ